MRPFAHPDGFDAGGLVDRLVLGITALIDDVVTGSEDAVREPVIPHELPDVFDRIDPGFNPGLDIGPAVG